jgi:UDP-2,3-diacylglucosamine pyrophosphatase LpxH
MELNVQPPQVVSKLRLVAQHNGDTFYVVPIGDIHWENRGSDKAALRKTIAFIRDTPNCLALIMGDVLDAIPHDDKRYHPGVARVEYLEEMESIWQGAVYKLAQELLPIRDKIIGIHTGNHEKVVAKRFHFDITKYLCDILNEDLIPKKLPLADKAAYLLKLSNYGCQIEPRAVRNLRYCAVTRLHFGIAYDKKMARDIDIWSHHGSGGGRKEGAAMNRIIEAQTIFEGADIYIMGHVHKEMSATRAFLYLNRLGDLKAVERKFVVAPSYLRSYEVGRRDDYAEQLMMSPATIGHVTIEIKPFIGAGGKEHSIDVRF